MHCTATSWIRTWISFSHNLIICGNRYSYAAFSQVNGQNVVKVGHRQVVNMIRQGGNSLMVKVVMVTRNPDMEEGSRKKSKDADDVRIMLLDVYIYICM